MRLRGLKRLACALFVGALAAGCVSLTPVQQRGAEAVRAMAAEMARAYGVRRIAVLVGDNMEGVGGTYRRGLFTLTTSMLTSRHRDSIVAHELAHSLLDHDRPLAGTLSLDWQRQQERRAPEAHAPARELLLRVRRLRAAQAMPPASRHVERLETVLATFAERALRRRRLAWALLAEPVDPLVDAERLAYRERYAALVASVLRAAIAARELPEQNVELTAAALVGGCGEALVGPLAPVGSGPSVDEVLIALRTFVRRAAGAPDPVAVG